MEYTSNERFLISLCSIENFEYKNKFLIYERVSEIQDEKEKIEIAKLCLKELLSVEKYNSLKNVFEKSYCDYLINDLNENGIKAVTIDSESYPKTLLEIENPPLILYAKGNIKLLKEQSIAIVGSRKSLPLSINICEDYVKAFIDADFTLVTGIAEGVDVTVLKMALKCSGKVISVLAGGLNNIYPKAHENIFNEVVKYGLVISENTPNTKVTPYMFPIRNRIIAGLGKATLVINGGIKSGTMYTAEFAIENGRDLFAVPYSIGVKSGEGANDLIKRGAILTDKPQDILDFYGIEKRQEKKQILSDKEIKIISAIESGICHIESIAENVGFSVTETKTILSLMEIKKLVVKDGINEFSLRS